MTIGDLKDRELALAAVRRATIDALAQNVPSEDIFTVLGEAFARYEQALKKGERTFRRVWHILGADMDEGADKTEAPRFQYNHGRMSEGERLRYRLFLGLAK